MTHGSNKKIEIFTAEEFIAAITQHIPDKNLQMVAVSKSQKQNGLSESMPSESAG